MKIKRKLLILFFILLAFLGYYFFPEKSLPEYITIDYLYVDKSKHIMEAYSNGMLVKKYQISLGRGEWGMHDGGSNITPVGIYTISSKLASSAFYKALPISYGHAIEIHGLKNGLWFIGKFHRLFDWTQGCIAVTDKEMDELFKQVKVGTIIKIEE